MYCMYHQNNSISFYTYICLCVCVYTYVYLSYIFKSNIICGYSNILQIKHLNTHLCHCRLNRSINVFNMQKKRVCVHIYVFLFFRVYLKLYMNKSPQWGRLYQANLIPQRILKDFLSPLKHIVIILIGFITQAESNAFLPIVFHSPEKLERNKRGWASQSAYCCSYSDQRSL